MHLSAQTMLAKLFFFFKQKTAYEITRRLEFRRVLFRSLMKSRIPFPSAAGGVGAGTVTVTSTVRPTGSSGAVISILWPGSTVVVIRTMADIGWPPRGTLPQLYQHHTPARASRLRRKAAFSFASSTHS